MQLYHLGERLRPVSLRLTGQPIHHIDADVVKARLAGVRHGLLRLTEVMPPANDLQKIAVAGLHANGKAVHALLTQKLEHIRVYAVGVALDGDLRVEAHIAV